LQITVEKQDEINYLIKGSVDNALIEEKVSKKKEEAKEHSEKEMTPEQIEQAAAGEIFQEFINEGIKQAQIPIDDVLGQPALRKYEKSDSSVYFEVEVAVDPKLDVKDLYKQAIPAFEAPQADEQSIDRKLEEFRLKNAPFVALEKQRAVERDDVAIIDFEGFIDGKPFEGGKAEKFSLKIGSNTFIPGFEEQLIGMEYGETRHIMVTFPKEYQAEDLAGKESEFKVTLHEIKVQKPEPLSDAYARSVLRDESATLQTLREKIAQQVVSEMLSSIYVKELKPKMEEALVSLYDFTLPNNIVEQEIDAMVKEKAHTFSKEEHESFVQDKEKFLALRESYREEAQKRIKLALIIEAVAKKENVTVDDQELQAALGYQAMIAGQDADELVKYYEENNLMASAKLALLQDKLFGQLLEFDRLNNIV